MKKAIKNTGTKIEKSKEKRIDVHFLWKREKKKEEKKKNIRRQQITHHLLPCTAL